MKKGTKMMVLAMVLATMVGLAGIGNAATISVSDGTVYQQDLRTAYDSTQIVSDIFAESGGWRVAQDTESGTAFMAAPQRTTGEFLVFHFQADAGSLIQQVSLFTRSYIWEGAWETLNLGIAYTTTVQTNIWDYYLLGTNIYYRDNQGTGTTGMDEDTALIDLGEGSQDLYICFYAYQSGYYNMDFSKNWFHTEGTSTGYDPGIIANFTVVPEPMAMAMLALGGMALVVKRKK